jgi:hypothetical protein
MQFEVLCLFLARQLRSRMSKRSFHAKNAHLENGGGNDASARLHTGLCNGRHRRNYIEDYTRYAGFGLCIEAREKARIIMTALFHNFPYTKHCRMIWRF